MAKGKKTGGKNFALGNCANPGGRPKTPDDVKQGRKLLQTEFERLGQAYALYKRTDLEAVIRSPDSTAWEGLVAGLFARAISGSVAHIKLLLERVLGSVPIHVESKPNDSTNPLHSLTNEELLQVVLLIREIKKNQWSLQQKTSTLDLESLPPSS